MELSNLSYTKGSRGHKTKTYGRGFGSGIGKTSGKGTKGQKSRKSGHTRLGFEGGQTPLYRRIPKVGFNNVNFAKNYCVINVNQLNKVKGGVINLETLKAAKLISKNTQLVKIIGNGNLKNAFQVSAHKFTTGAKNAIEKAGGKVEVITPVKKVKAAKVAVKATPAKTASTKKTKSKTKK